jgi:hypothetical protein
VRARERARVTAEYSTTRLKKEVNKKFIASKKEQKKSPHKRRERERE